MHIHRTHILTYVRMYVCMILHASIVKIISLSTVMLNVGINRYYYDDAILGLNEGKSHLG